MNKLCIFKTRLICYSGIFLLLYLLIAEGLELTGGVIVFDWTIWYHANSGIEFEQERIKFPFVLTRFR